MYHVCFLVPDLPGEGVEKRKERVGKKDKSGRDKTGTKDKKRKRHGSSDRKKSAGSQKEKGKRKKAKAGRRDSSVESVPGKSGVEAESEDDSESEQSSRSSSDSSSEDSDSSSSRGKSKRGKKKGKRAELDWELLEELWPLEDRPHRLQSKKGTRGLSMSKLMRLKEQFEKENERKGLGSAVYGLDKKPKAIKFKSMRDDGERALHPARFEGLPRIEPAKYWDLVPTTRSNIFRHIPLLHLGVTGVAESTVVKLHNRKVPVELQMFRRDVIADIKHVEEALWNYVMLLRSLHPADHGAVVLMRVLAESGYVEVLGDSVKDRVGIIKKFFDDTVRENSGRAVRKEPPLDYDAVKSRLVQYVAAAVPGLSLIGVRQQMMVMGAGRGQPAASQSPGGPGVTTAGQMANPAKGNRGGGSGRGGRGGYGRGGGSAGPIKTPARFNGLAVCFQYNSAAGCSRPAQGAQACKDGNIVYAHVCNFLLRSQNGQATHCYAAHSKVGNH